MEKQTIILLIISIGAIIGLWFLARVIQFIQGMRVLMRKTEEIVRRGKNDFDPLINIGKRKTDHLPSEEYYNEVMHDPRRHEIKASNIIRREFTIDGYLQISLYDLKEHGVIKYKIKTTKPDLEVYFTDMDCLHDGVQITNLLLPDTAVYEIILIENNNRAILNLGEQTIYPAYILPWKEEEQMPLAIYKLKEGEEIPISLAGYPDGKRKFIFRIEPLGAIKKKTIIHLDRRLINYLDNNKRIAAIDFDYDPEIKEYEVIMNKVGWTVHIDITKIQR